MNEEPKKSLGQHWLKDLATLEAIANYAALSSDDTVVEIGPGLGTLTEIIDKQTRKVIAVEYDSQLAKKLKNRTDLKATEVIEADFLQCDLSELPVGYKIVGNIPYYITSKIVQKILTDHNKPSIAVLLVQKEVAERLAAEPGAMSVLSIAAQVYAEVELDIIVPAKLFEPSPKVNSQVVVLRPRKSPLVSKERIFFRLVKAGFSERRKKLRSSLSGGMGIKKHEAEALLESAGINPNKRAQDLSIDDWINLSEQLE